MLITTNIKNHRFLTLLYSINPLATHMSIGRKNIFKNNKNIYLKPYTSLFFPQGTIVYFSNLRIGYHKFWAQLQKVVPKGEGKKRS